MSTAAALSNDPRATSVEVTGELITAELADGRVISIPLNWSWRLSDATTSQRVQDEIIAHGSGIRWLDMGQDLSVHGMLNGVPARRPAAR